MPHVLAVGPMMTPVMEALERAFTVHKLYEAENPDRLLDEVGPLVRGAASTAFRSMDAALQDRLPKLEIISHFGVGYDSVDVRHAKSRGIDGDQVLAEYREEVKRVESQRKK